MSRAGFAYAQARMHARLASRFDLSGWQLLESGRDLGHCLDTLRRTAVAPMVSQLNAGSDAHQIERSLRQGWCDLLTSVCHWSPVTWQNAVSWFGLLPHLRWVEFLQSEETRPDWLQADPSFGPLLQSDPSVPTTTGPNCLGPALTQLIFDRDQSVSDLWLSGWKARMPGAKQVRQVNLTVDQILQRYLGHTPDRHKIATNEGLEDLSAQLIRNFRTQAQTPAAVFSYLGLVALDFERLRGILVSRSVFDDTGIRGSG